MLRLVAQGEFVRICKERCMDSYVRSQRSANIKQALFKGLPSLYLSVRTVHKWIDLDSYNISIPSISRRVASLEYACDLNLLRKYFSHASETSQRIWHLRPTAGCSWLYAYSTAQHTHLGSGKDSLIRLSNELIKWLWRMTKESGWTTMSYNSTFSFVSGTDTTAK